MSSSTILVFDVNICAVECWKQALFCCMIWPCPVSMDGGNFVNPSFTWEVLSVVWRYLWPLTALVLSFLSLSLSFVDIFLFAKRKGAIFILANCDRRMCWYFVPKVIIWGSPYWALAFEGNLGEVLCSLLTWHVLHTLLCYSFVVVFSLLQTSRPAAKNHFQEIQESFHISLHYIVLYYYIIFVIIKYVW